MNSNLTTIMTDPLLADATYIEPIRWESVAKIIEKERPSALLPMGTTPLNCALDLDRKGILEQFGVQLIGANADAIDKAEDRDRFDKAMKTIGLDTPRSHIAHTMDEARAASDDLGYPCIIRLLYYGWIWQLVLLITEKNLRRFVSVVSICLLQMSC